MVGQGDARVDVIDAEDGLFGVLPVAAVLRMPGHDLGIGVRMAGHQHEPADVVQ